MANTTTSTNMALPVPVVGVDTGPQWATDLNSCLTLIDSHNHAAGSGVQISPGGLNINSDLTFNSNNATVLRSVRFTPQIAVLSAPTDLGCLYEVALDLWYNDGNGNQVRITQSGGVAGSPGSISNLNSPASAAYVAANQTFVWQSAASTPANLDAGSVILRNITASSKGLTLNPPNAMGSNYSLTLPSLPGSTGPITCDSSGNMGVTTYDAVGQGMTSTGANAVAASRTRATGSTVSTGGVAISASCGNTTSSSTSPQTVTNLTVTIRTSGRPVQLFLVSDNSGSAATFGLTGVSGITTANLNILRDGSTFSYNSISVNGAGRISVPASSIAYVDNIGSSGNFTYSVQIYISSGSASMFISNAVLVAYEL